MIVRRFFLYDLRLFNERHLMVTYLEHKMNLPMIDRFDLLIYPLYEFPQCLLVHSLPFSYIHTNLLETNACKGLITGYDSV